MLANGWERYANAATCMSADCLGRSLPGPAAYAYFGFSVDEVVRKLRTYLARLRGD